MKEEIYFYVGTYTETIRFGTGKVLEGKGEGIYTCALNRSNGDMRVTRVRAGVENPSYLAFGPGGHHLYAVNELKTVDGRPGGAVSAFTLEAATGRIEFINRQPSGGTDPCHLTVDSRGRHIFTANFMSGSVSVFRYGPMAAWQRRVILCSTAVRASIHHDRRGRMPMP